jgi:hypothetical protein
VRLRCTPCKAEEPGTPGEMEVLAALVPVVAAFVMAGIQEWRSRKKK